MSISFTNKKEALEYQKMMVQTEQIASSLNIKDGKYIVTLIDKESINIHVIPTKEYYETEEGAEGARGIHFGPYLDEKDHNIYIPPNASTSTKLHELGHARYGHKVIIPSTLTNLIKRELDAESFQYMAKDKELTFKIGVDTIKQVINNYPRMNPISIINEVSRKLEERGIEVTRKNKKWFIDNIYTKTNDPEVEEWKEDLKEEF